ncbi:hypothetical protein IscW_ISCW012151 [Ixodes scapularis]|uniref:Uncharacterized protein n=1 Tax=Ixodes scapularis TaxID=6945 RepID=B7QED5_IXOSC|nr:hypothetical protein IscW_ISCW012151 [Ixodes scapularis]|eukprot:XP_002413899.1 hypothetical protein IscW_ISCW012151 [Ixodes scapularis]
MCVSSPFAWRMEKEAGMQSDDDESGRMRVSVASTVMGGEVEDGAVAPARTAVQAREDRPTSYSGHGDALL